MIFIYVKLILIYFNSYWYSLQGVSMGQRMGWAGGLWMPARRKSGQYIGRGTLIDAILYYRFSATVHAVKPATHTHTDTSTGQVQVVGETHVHLNMYMHIN